MQRASRFLALASLALSLPGLVLAQSRAPFVVDPTWPVNGGTDAPEYRRADMTGVAVDPEGRVFACRGGPDPVLVFDRDGRFLHSFGGRVLEEPHTCRTDSEGNVWLTDFHQHQLYKFSADGTLLAEYGVRHRPSRAPGHFSGPNDLAFAPNGDIYVAEGDGDRVSHLASDGRFINAWGKRGKTPGKFLFPHSIAVDSQGRVYVADRGNSRIQVFTASGQFLAQWRIKDRPYGLFITPDGRLFTANGKSDTISIYNLSGQLIAKWGRSGSRAGRLNEPHNLCVDEQGRLYVAEAGARRVQRWLPR